MINAVIRGHAHFEFFDFFDDLGYFENKFFLGTGPPWPLTRTPRPRPRVFRTFCAIWNFYEKKVYLPPLIINYGCRFLYAMNMEISAGLLCKWTVILMYVWPLTPRPRPLWLFRLLPSKAKFVTATPDAPIMYHLPCSRLIRVAWTNVNVSWCSR
jgi:hypothetical protein